MFSSKNIIKIIFILIFLLFSISISAEKQWVHIVDILNPTPLEKIKQRYTAYDYNDGNITNNLTFETTYNHENCQVGEYDLIVKIINSKGEISTHHDIILVRDFINPTISTSILELHLNKEEQITEETIKSYFICEDNLDSNLNIIIENFPEEIKEGIYEIIVYCIDSSTNISNKIEFTLYIEDSTQKEIINYTLVINKKINEKQIIDLLKENNYLPSSYKNISITSSYLDTNKPGIYSASAIVTLEDDSIKIIYFKINYQVEKTNNYWIFYVIGTTILIIGIMIIIYRKRAQ